MKRAAQNGVLVALGAMAFGCGAAERPNILLVTVDTLRADRLSCYGYERHRTPNIDRLAAGGALFENAMADSPWTTPSMASVLTGSYPAVHGFRSMTSHRLSPENLTLAEQLREHGFATAAVVGSFPLDSIFQLDQGFDSYDDDFTEPIFAHPDHQVVPMPSQFHDSPGTQRHFIFEKAFNHSRRTDAQVTDAALHWLGQQGHKPFFLWVHYYGPHDKSDWSVPEAERDPIRLARYDPDVRENDREVGRLLSALDEAGLAETTLVVFHADHGESLGERGYIGHGQLFNEASVHVPLIFRLPGVVKAGLRVERLARNIDILPTILEVVGVSPPPDLSGESLLPQMHSSPERRAAHPGPEPIAYMETYYPAHWGFALPVTLADGTEARIGLVRRGVRRGRWKYERTDPTALLDGDEGEFPVVPEAMRRAARVEQLYDVSARRGDETNVIKSYPRVARELRALLDRYIALERARAPADRVEIDDETRRRLESLGYAE